VSECPVRAGVCGVIEAGLEGMTAWLRGLAALCECAVGV
jgi:hypothetical protein